MKSKFHNIASKLLEKISRFWKRRWRVLFACLIVGAAIFLVLFKNIFFSDISKKDWWMPLMGLFSFASFATLMAFRQERAIMLAWTPYWRLPWRVFLSLCLLLCILSSTQWLIGASDIKSIQEFLRTISSNTNSTGTKAADTLGGGAGFLIAAFATVIGFVTKHIYGIAKDAEDQVKNLDESLQIAKTALLKVELHVSISTLLDELDVDNKFFERNRINSIRQFIIESDSLFKDPVDIPVALKRLQSKVLIFQNRELPSDDFEIDQKYSDFLRKKFAPFLEDLHFRLRGTQLSQATDGRACLDQVAIFWRILR